MFCFLLLLLCPFVVFLSLFFTNYELLILTMIAVLFYGIYLSLPVWRNFFLLSFYALEYILLFCFHFICCFTFILTTSYSFLYVGFFQPHALILRFSWALISMLIFHLLIKTHNIILAKPVGGLWLYYTEENYEGLDLQVLDVQNKRMYSKPAVGGDYISVKVGPFDDVAISKKIIINNQLLLEHDHTKDLLVINSLPEFRLSNHFYKYKMEE